MTGQPITFIVNGLEQAGASAGATRGAAAVALPAALTRGRVKQSVRVGVRRGGGLDRIRVSAVPGDDIVVLHIAGGPSLVLHPENARDKCLVFAALCNQAGLAYAEKDLPALAQPAFHLALAFTLRALALAPSPPPFTPSIDRLLFQLEGFDLPQSTLDLLSSYRGAP